MEIRIGARVLAQDGPAGRVERIILHPETNEVVGLVMREDRMLARDVLIPSDRIEAADADGVRVRATREELADFEEFSLNQYVTPPEDWIPPTGDAVAFFLFPRSPYLVGAFDQVATQPDPPVHEVEDIPPCDVDVSERTPVFCRDGEAGHLERVLTEGDSDRVTHVIVRRDGRERLVPADRIERMTQEGVYLALTCSELDSLPAPRE